MNWVVGAGPRACPEGENETNRIVKKAGPRACPEGEMDKNEIEMVNDCGEKYCLTGSMMKPNIVVQLHVLNKTHAMGLLWENYGNAIIMNTLSGTRMI